jgi:hypothetical protein
MDKERNDMIWEMLEKIVPQEELRKLPVKDFFDECVSMTQLYAKKNHDYGDSFNNGMDAIGLSYGVGRLFDKMNRILTLTKVKPEITDESIIDTVKDLACYAVMTSVYLNYERKIQKTNINFE